MVPTRPADPTAPTGYDREVYLQVYRGRAWPPVIHTAVYTDGDIYEWTFGSASRLQVNGSTLHGVIPEYAGEHDYGAWKFWKAVSLGRHRDTVWPASDDTGDPGDPDDTADPTQRSIVRALASSEQCFADGSYRALSRNCWDFCAHLATALVGGSTRSHLDRIHALNDVSLGVPVGTTGFVRRRLTGCGVAIAPLCFVLLSAVFVLLRPRIR